MKLNEKIPAWKATKLLERLSDCATMLYAHDILTTAERVKVYRRLIKRQERERNVK